MIRRGRFVPLRCVTGDRRAAYIVAAREFVECRALRAASDGLFLLSRCEERGSAHVLSLGLGAAPTFGGAGADQIALHVGEASEYGEHQAPGAGAGVGPRLRQGSKLRLGVRDALDDGEQVEGAASEAVDPRHRHHVAGSRRQPQGRQWVVCRPSRYPRIRPPDPSRRRSNSESLRRTGALHDVECRDRTAETL